MKPPSRAELEQHKDEAAPTHDQVRQEIAAEALTYVGKPDEMPADVWELVQENGRVATERLHEILTSERFKRLRSSDQARLIKLAQDRAYGIPAASKPAGGGKNQIIDMTSEQMRQLADRSRLPEYRYAETVERKDVTPNLRKTDDAE